MKHWRTYYYLATFLAPFFCTDELVAWVFVAMFWIPALLRIGCFIAERTND